MTIGQRLAGKGMVGSLALAVAVFLSAIALPLPFPQQTTDELAHLSYALQLRDMHFVPPSLDTLVMYDAETRLPGHKPNYLNHPAIAYYPLAAVLQLVPSADIAALRALSAATGLLAYFVYLRLGAESIRSRLGFACYAFFPDLLCFPVLFAQLTPDTFLTLGGVLVAYGWQRFAAAAPGAPRWITLGILLASLKFNSLLLVLFYSAAYAWKFRRQWRSLALPIGAAILSTLPYLLLTWHWGSPAPTTPGQLAMLQQPAAHFPDDPSGFLAYIGFALRSFAQHHVGGEALTGYYAVPLGLLLLGMMWATAQAARGRLQSCLIGATLVSFVATFAIHLLFSYRRYMDYHWMYDFYPRYYAPLLPGLGLLFVQGLTAAPQWLLSRVRKRERHG